MNPKFYRMTTEQLYNLYDNAAEANDDETCFAIDEELNARWLDDADLRDYEDEGFYLPSYATY